MGFFDRFRRRPKAKLTPAQKRYLRRRGMSKGDVERHGHEYVEHLKRKGIK